MLVIFCLLAGKDAHAFFDDFDTAPTSCQVDTDTFGNWTVVFAGGGCANKEHAQAAPQYKVFLHMQPQTSTSSSETHAVLVCGPSFSANHTSYYFMADVKTVSQLRTGSLPNSWEAAWFVFDYTDNDHYNYFLLKTDGWELGKRHPNCSGGQCFLATGSSPSLTVGNWNQIEIDRDYTDGKNNFQVYVDNSLVVNTNDNTNPLISGNICLYTEDAHVHYSNVEANQD